LAQAAGSWADDPLYRDGLEALQLGQWSRAEEAFAKLLAQHQGEPGAAGALEPLLENARLRRSLEERYARKVARGRRWRLSKRAVLWALIVLVAAVAAFLFFASWRAEGTSDPAASAAATARAQRAELLKQAQAEVAAGRYVEGIALLQEIVERFPADAEAQQLLAWARERWELAEHYANASALLGQERWAEAIPVLELILQRDPAYRDASALLEKAQQGVATGDSWARAKQAMSAGRWEEAAGELELIQKSYPQFRREEVSSLLYECYLNLGLAALDTAPGDAAGAQRALEWFNKALTQRPGDSRAGTERMLAQMFVKAVDALQSSRLDQAISLLQSIYDTRFNYMAGMAAQMLYDAYMARAAARVAAGEIEKAVADYAAAERLTGPDTSEASRQRLAYTMSLTPTPTATPFKWSPSLLPTATPEPTPPPLSSFKGQIAFWTDREGVQQLYLMNPDGTNQRPANLSRWGRSEFEQLRKQEMISPDGRWQLYVAAGNNRIAQIWIMEIAIPANNRQLTSLDGVCYDAVWSPDGYHIAFVSEHTGSDDIWVIGADGQGLRQLTRNSWEWEKHPSWSPDGWYIVYWSNIDTGRQQIWIMNADGTNQRNLSNSPGNDWDPIWIK
jgi:TolB protein